MKTFRFFFTLATATILASCLSNNDRCIRKLCKEAGVAEEQIARTGHLVVIQAGGCGNCIRRAFTEMHESEDTVYIVACRSEKAFRLIAQKNIEDFSNVYLDRQGVAADMGMVKNAPMVYVLKEGKYLSHHYYGQKKKQTQHG